MQISTAPKLRTALHHFEDPASGLNARIALYGSLDHPALGGIRILPYETDEAADRDAERLAYGMARKAAALNLPYCGGKTVVRGDPEQIKSPDLWKALGHAINSLKGLYVGGEDVNMRLRDVTALSRHTRYVVGTLTGCGNPAPYTALGVFRAMKAAAMHRFGNTHLMGRRILLQGAGSVGRELASLLAAEEADLTVCDVNPRHAILLAERHGARIADPAEVMEISSDIFCPCALGPAITATNVEEIETKIIVGAANNQLADNALARTLHARDITYVPDYLANAGGLIAGAGEHRSQRDFLSFDRQAVTNDINRIFDLVAGYLKQAETMDMPPLDVCEEYVSRKLGEGDAVTPAEAGSSSSSAPRGPHGWSPL